MGLLCQHLIVAQSPQPASLRTCGIARLHSSSLRTLRITPTTPALSNSTTTTATMLHSRISRTLLRRNFASRYTALTSAELESEQAGKLRDAGWTFDGAALRKDFELGNFSRAWGFMSRVALAAEKMEHHPDWSNSFGTVRVSLSTHAIKSLSNRDLKFATAIQAISERP